MRTRYTILLSLSCLFAFVKCKSEVQKEATTSFAVSNSQSDTISKRFYADGKLQEVFLKKDSGVCEKLVQEFYPNGILKRTGCQGSYSDKDISTGIYVGTWNTYDSSGHLQESIYYYNDAQPKAFIEKTLYYEDGKKKSIQRFNNYELYESEIDSIGDWKYYDANGKEIKTIKHKKQ